MLKRNSLASTASRGGLVEYRARISGNLISSCWKGHATASAPRGRSGIGRYKDR